jgi:hypothetical protein
MTPDQARRLLELAADDLEADRLSPSLRRFAVTALRALAESRTLPRLPDVQDNRGSKAALDTYAVFGEIVAEMDRSNSTGREAFDAAIDMVAGIYQRDEKTIRRTLDRIKQDDKVLELILLADHARTE